MFFVVQIQLALKLQATLTDIWCGVFWKRNVKFKEIESNLCDMLLKFCQGKSRCIRSCYHFSQVGSRLIPYES